MTKNRPLLRLQTLVTENGRPISLAVILFGGIIRRATPVPFWLLYMFALSLIPDMQENAQSTSSPARYLSSIIFFSTGVKLSKICPIAVSTSTMPHSVVSISALSILILGRMEAHRCMSVAFFLYAISIIVSSSFIFSLF